MTEEDLRRVGLADRYGGGSGGIYEEGRGDEGLRASAPPEGGEREYITSYRSDKDADVGDVQRGGAPGSGGQGFGGASGGVYEEGLEDPTGGGFHGAGSGGAEAVVPVKKNLKDSDKGLDMDEATGMHRHPGTAGAHPAMGGPGGLTPVSIGEIGGGGMGGGGAGEGSGRDQEKHIEQA
ncbi:hypothetical protein N2152v2_011039 [Parachlorella kessleri]